jgi:glycosyltransferase involved in cell wall biosynthesis
MKVALVHYWLVRMRGGEKVLEQLCSMFPDADIITHVYDAAHVSAVINRHRVRTTFINNLPFARKRYQDYLPLMPMALEQMDMQEYDLVISSESGPAKGVIARPDATHLCYCHTPMRYLWNMYPFYLNQANLARRALMSPIANYLRMWDHLSAQRVDSFVANSLSTAQRIKRYYDRQSVVVYPPVEVDSFTPSLSNGGYYLCLGQLIPYKRADIAIRAFNALRLPLRVVGDGSEIRNLRAIAKDNIEFIGWASTEELHEHYAHCEALIFPGEEDFGIVPVEAMASGKPVIAYGRGGALETVVPGRTGLLFEHQHEDSLRRAVEQFQENRAAYDPSKIGAFAAQFRPEAFRSGIFDAIARAQEKTRLALLSFARPAENLRMAKQALEAALPLHAAFAEPDARAGIDGVWQVRGSDPVGQPAEP